jgi:hypothetical protein
MPGTSQYRGPQYPANELTGKDALLVYFRAIQANLRALPNHIDELASAWQEEQDQLLGRAEGGENTLNRSRLARPSADQLRRPPDVGRRGTECPVGTPLDGMVF